MIFIYVGNTLVHASYPGFFVLSCLRNLQNTGNPNFGALLVHPQAFPMGMGSGMGVGMGWSWRGWGSRMGRGVAIAVDSHMICLACTGAWARQWAEAVACAGAASRLGT